MSNLQIEINACPSHQKGRINKLNERKQGLKICYRSLSDIALGITEEADHLLPAAVLKSERQKLLNQAQNLLSPGPDGYSVYAGKESEFDLLLEQLSQQFQQSQFFSIHWNDAIYAVKLKQLFDSCDTD